MEAPPATGRLAPPGQRRKLPTDRDANGKMPQRPLLQPLACKGLAQEWAGTFVNPPLFDPDKVDASEARASLQPFHRGGLLLWHTDLAAWAGWAGLGGTVRPAYAGRALRKRALEPRRRPPPQLRGQGPYPHWG